MKSFGVIGLGSIGMRHAKNLVELGYQVYGYDPDRDKAEELMNYYADEQFPPGTSDSMEEIVKMSDAIVVANPTHLHQKTYMDIVVAGGDKPVFMEKPIAHVYDEMMRNIKMVGYNLRFHSCVQAAKEWLDNGSIGKPLWGNFVCSQHTAKPDYMRDGVILNWSHEIDLALYFLGPATVATSSTRLTNGHDDMTDICLNHTSTGCRSTVHLDYVTKPEIRQSIVVGSEATIILDIINRQAWLRGKAGFVMDHFTGVDTFDDNYMDEMYAFVDRTNGKFALGCTASEAIEVLQICKAVKEQAGLI